MDIWLLYRCVWVVTGKAVHLFACVYVCMEITSVVCLIGTNQQQNIKSK